MAERRQEPDVTPGSPDSLGDSRGLHRTLGLGEVTAGGVGIIIGAVHPAPRAPIRAIAVAAVVAGMFALIGDLTLIAAVTDFAVYVVFLAVNAAVILLRWTKPGISRPFTVPWSVRGTPVLPVLGLVSVLVTLTQLEARAVWMGLAVCAAGVTAAFLLRPGGRSAAA
jgi:APA family basic amino acid/polyamine antiporter